MRPTKLQTAQAIRSTALGMSLVANMTPADIRAFLATLR